MKLSENKLLALYPCGKGIRWTQRWIARSKTKDLGRFYNAIPHGDWLYWLLCNCAETCYFNNFMSSEEEKEYQRLIDVAAVFADVDSGELSSTHPKGNAKEFRKRLPWKKIQRVLEIVIGEGNS